jgi:hypothetical protein
MIEELKDIFDEYYEIILFKINEVFADYEKELKIKTKEMNKIFRFICLLLFLYMIKDGVLWLINKF